MSLCVICNKQLPSPLPAECHFPVAETDRKILLLGLFRSGEISENRVKTLHSIATSSTVLCHSHISKAAWSFFSSIDPSFDYQDTCNQLKWMLRKSETEVEGHLTMECRPELLDTMRRIYSHLELVVLYRHSVLSFVLNAGKCSCDESLTVNNYEFIDVNDQVATRPVPPGKEKKRLAGDELLPDDIRPPKKSREFSSDHHDDSTSSMPPTKKKSRRMVSAAFEVVRSTTELAATGSTMTSSGSIQGSSGPYTANISATPPNTPEWNFLAMSWHDSSREYVKWGLMDDLTAADVEAIEQLLRSRGLHMKKIDEPDTTTRSQPVSPPKAATKDAGLSSGTAVPMVQTVPSLTQHPASNSRGNSPTPHLTGSSHGNSSGTLSATSRVTSIPSSSSSSSAAQSDDGSGSEDRVERRKNDDLSEIGRDLDFRRRIGFRRQHKNYDLDRILVKSHRFDLSHLHNLSPDEKHSHMPTEIAGIRFDFLAVALRFRPVYASPNNTLKAFCAHLITETIPERFRHLFSSIRNYRNLPLLSFPRQAVNSYIKVVLTCHGVNSTSRFPQKYALEAALHENAFNYANQIISSCRAAYNTARRNDFGGPEKRSVTPCQIAAALHKKKHGLQYDEKLEKYFEEAAKFDMNGAWQ